MTDLSMTASMIIEDSFESPKHEKQKDNLQQKRVKNVEDVDSLYNKSGRYN